MQRTFAKAAYWQNNVIDYHIFGDALLRPTISSSPENSHFSQKLLSSCTEAALEHLMFLLLKTGKKSDVEWGSFFQIFGI